MKEAEHWRTLDEHGMQMPWYTRSCCKWLETQDLTLRMVFEYGGGDSTLWYRSRGAIVEGVDLDPGWAQKSGLHFTDKEDEYLEYIDRFGLFDVICIDGHFRDKCLFYALRHLKKDGVIIIDNWKQPSAGWAEWPFTEQLIGKLKMTEYREPKHEDWKTITLTR